MTSAKEIKKRIRSISNTKKITKAMEMVAAAKMRRSVEAVLKTRTYANLGWETIVNIAASAAFSDIKHPLLQKGKDAKPSLIVLVSSNRGLCGGFNSAIINKAIRSVQKHDKGADFIIIGKRGAAVSRRFGYEIIAEFPKNDANPGLADVIPLAKMIVREFLSGNYSKVVLAYTDFVNPVKQVPRVRQLLPIDVDTEDEYLGAIGKSDKLGTNKEFIKEKDRKHLGSDYMFKYEPNEIQVFEMILPRMIEVQLLQALLESNASEHSARMAAMHQATGAASDLVDELTLFYNKARQAAITSEIAEISAGAASLAAK